jgi:hypothetical protein
MVSRAEDGISTIGLEVRLSDGLAIPGEGKANPGCTAAVGPTRV